MKGTFKGPQARIRINHTRTARDGWKCSETTIEVDGTLKMIDGDWFIANDPDSGGAVTTRLESILQELSQEAHVAGETEAQRRNNADKQDTLYGPGDPDMSEVPF